MEEENRNAYSEVLEILKWVDDEKKLEALPIETLEVLKSKSNPEYKPQISKDIPLDEQNLQPETFSILSWIATKYWSDEMEDVEASVNPVNITENMEDVEASVNSVNITDTDSVNITNTENVTENIEQEDVQHIEEVKEEDAGETTINIEGISNMPIAYKDLKWYEKVRIKIVEFFNRIFRGNKRNKEVEN